MLGEVVTAVTTTTPSGAGLVEEDIDAAIARICCANPKANTEHRDD